MLSAYSAHDSTIDEIVLSLWPRVYARDHTQSVHHHRRSYLRRRRSRHQRVTLCAMLQKAKSSKDKYETAKVLKTLENSRSSKSIICFVEICIIHLLV